MKTLIKTLALVLAFSLGVIQAQTAVNSWVLGFGLTYPRLYSANITTLNTNWGAYGSIQRNFSENVGLRLRGGYANLNGEWTDMNFNKVKASTDLVTADLDLIFFLVPCAPVSPYLFAGVGANYKSTSNPQTAFPDENKFGSQLNVGLGAEFKFSPIWSVVAEFGYHVTNNSELEGTIVPAEINGHDSWMALNLGFNYTFQKGDNSKDCEPCEGIRADKDMTDYNRIEDMINKHIPKEVVKEVIREIYVDKYIIAVAEDKLVLVGVNFAWGKSDLLPESYVVLDKSVKLLKDRSTVKVEIEGYTDYTGPVEYNQQLSVDRAQRVKDYLVQNGIDASRLTIVGYGEGNPIADNTTEEGRAMNRRIVFRILK
ncbi:MAG: OmpA family protein [Ignavibacteria bacterium]|nr:OmpA family protein [Ignavibacteria bacterium]